MWRGLHPGPEVGLQSPDLSLERKCVMQVPSISRGLPASFRCRTDSRTDSRTAVAGSYQGEAVSVLALHSEPPMAKGDDMCDSSLLLSS